MQVSLRKRLLLDILLVVLSVILERFTSIRVSLMGVVSIRIGLGGLPLLLAGFMFEPVDALFVGAFSDIVGYYVLHPAKPYILYFTITSALKGWIPSFIHKHFFKKDFKFAHIFISIIIGLSLSNLLLVPYFLHLSFGIPFWDAVKPRLIALPPYLIIYPYFITFFVRDWWLKR